jgi:hypothetical protein
VIIQSGMFKKQGNEAHLFEKKVADAIRELKVIIAKENECLINVFKFNSEENSYDIEMSILKALLNCNLARNAQSKYVVLNF